MSEEKLAENNR